MRSRFAVLAVCLAVLMSAARLGPEPPGDGVEATAPDWADALGGKLEHCALAIGMIGGALLSLFANPIMAPAAYGFIEVGLVWLALCN